MKPIFLYPLEKGKDALISQKFGENKKDYSALYVRNCSFCNKQFESIYSWSKNCSRICTKRKYHVPRTATSRFKPDDKFWQTETGKGMKWEKWFAEKVGGAWVNEEIMGQPYDVLWNGKKIDVKVSNYFEPIMRKKKLNTNHQGWWAFHGDETPNKDTDYYACVALKNDIPVKCLVIPGDLYRMRKGLCIGKKSQFDIYNIL